MTLELRPAPPWLLVIIIQISEIVLVESLPQYLLEVAVYDILLRKYRQIKQFKLTVLLLVVFFGPSTTVKNTVKTYCLSGLILALQWKPNS